MDPRFSRSHPEDVAICRTNRPLLELEFGIEFAERQIADRFSYERSVPAGPTFGFHGVFNMIPALGPERFWQIYESLDDRGTVGTDYGLLMRQLRSGREPTARRIRLTFDAFKRAFKG
jgi:hypothetical protein